MILKIKQDYKHKRTFKTTKQCMNASYLTVINVLPHYIKKIILTVFQASIIKIGENYFLKDTCTLIILPSTSFSETFQKKFMLF